MWIMFDIIDFLAKIKYKNASKTSIRVDIFNEMIKMC